MAVVGHRQIRAQLADQLPAVSLFIGPRSVGKRTMAEYLAKHWDISGNDLMRVNKLTTGNARELVKFLSVSPSGSRKLAIVNIDRPSLGAMNILLKTLEESPSRIHVILISTLRPVATITSRCDVFEFGLLQKEEVERILRERKGVRPTEAGIAAKQAGGRVDVALQSLDGFEAKQTVLEALRAFESRNAQALDAIALKWTDECTDMLALWCTETITCRWKMFSPEDSEIKGHSQPLKILMALREEIRPRLVVRASLMSILQGA